MNFLKYKYIYFLISALLVVPSILALVFWGLKPSIDFTGGSVLEIKLVESQGKTSEVDEVILRGWGIGGIQRTDEDTYILKTEQMDKNKKQELLGKLKEEYGEIEEIRFETVGPTIGKELVKKTLISIGLASGFIMLYVAFRFKDKKYGISAVLAMFHDSLILLGIFSILGHFFGVEVDALFVTAVLTILSFSVHDTVVVYDRIRESVNQYPKEDFEALVNKAIAETLVRSVNNSMTIIFMLLALYLLGGETIRWFVFALLIGTIAGTYSSTFTAAPLLVVWEKLKKGAD